MIISLSKKEAQICGMGSGADCCVFLVAGISGFECARQTSLRNTLINSRPRMTAQRIPTEPIPYCRTIIVS